MFDIRTIPIENGCDLRFKQKNHSIIFCKFEEFYCFQPVCLYISNFIELTIVNSKLHSYDMSSGVVNSFHMRHKNRIIYFDKCFICYSHSIKLFTWPKTRLCMRISNYINTSWQKRPYSYAKIIIIFPICVVFSWRTR